MFFRRGIFMRTILLILLIGIFASVAGRSSYNEGWTNGYVAAQTLAQGENGGATIPPLAMRDYGYRGRGLGLIGWFFGGLLTFWLFLLLVGLSLKFLGWGLWGQRRRHKHGDGPHHPWHWHHGAHSREDDVPHEKSPEDVEPDIRSV